jgi:hypothetical protein
MFEAATPAVAEYIRNSGREWKITPPVRKKIGVAYRGESLGFLFGQSFPERG